MTISLTFPDGAKREFPSGITGVEIAKGISPSLLKRTVAMALDGTVVDLADPITADAKIELLNREDPRALELIRHDTAHVLAEAVQEVFGRVGTQVIGTRHGEKLFETLMTREERLRAEDMGGYYRVACDSRDLNYDKFVVDGEVETQADESYTSHNTERLDVEGTIAKIKTAEYVQLALKGREHEAVQ